MSFQPFRNPIGFGAVDFIEIALALLLVAFILLRPWLETQARRFAERTLWCMLALAALPVVLRLALLPYHPVPVPNIYDEFGHLLVADTLRHLRIANPLHPMHRFFETFFVLQEPAYSSIYPLGQGIVLAFGRLLFGLPWAGVVLTAAAFCPLTYWMLRAWVSPFWALAGGLLAVLEFGPLNTWMNSYWGGSLAACAGCLVFGALPRLKESRRIRDGVLLGIGLGFHVLTRPFESIFLLISAVLFLIPAKPKWSPALAAASILLAALGLTLLQNWRVTGRINELPYQLSQYQYGVPAALTFQSDPVPHRDLTPQQAMEYKSQLSFRNSGTETLTSYFERLAYRARFYRFFFLAPLYLAFAAYLLAYRSPHWLWVLFTLTLFALGTNFFPAFQYHYIAAVTCLFVLVSVTGLQRIAQWPGGREAAALLFFLCVIDFGFLYSRSMASNPGKAERRTLVSQTLEKTPGQLLVFVRYSPQHIFQDEWVYNDADIDGSRIVWARDRGPIDNEELRRYYPKRAAWLLDPDVQPPRLIPYQPEPVPAPSPPLKEAVKPSKRPVIQLEQVR
jgi:hypothetical protein